MRSWRALGVVCVLCWASSSPSIGEEAARLADALKKGEPLLALRYRFEDVADDGVGDRDARASTLRTTLGFRTLDYKGWSLFLEAEDVMVVGSDDYNNAGAGSLANGVTDRPVVADPDGTEMNQGYVQLRRGKTRLRLGRQEILIDDHRFVGNVGWRQNHQSFDAFSLVNESLDRVTFTYAFVDNVNRINGGNHEMASHLLNAAIELGRPGRLTLYGYQLDYDARPNAGLSTTTLGAELSGTWKRDDAPGLVYELEVARQRDSGDNPREVDAGYLHLLVGGVWPRVKARLGLEVLEGDARDGQFRTPLATLHKFNGWADKFLNTPTNGLEDLYFELGGRVSEVDWILAYHDFNAAEGSLDYGEEIDVQLLYKTPWDQVIGLKGALYDADRFSADTDKWMLWTSYAVAK